MDLALTDDSTTCTPNMTRSYHYHSVTTGYYSARTTRHREASKYGNLTPLWSYPSHPPSPDTCPSSGTPEPS